MVYGGRKNKKSAPYMLMLVMLVVLPLTVGLACGFGPKPAPPTPTPPTAPPTVAPDPTSTIAPTNTPTATEPPVTPVEEDIPLCAESETPNTAISKIAKDLQDLYGVALLNRSDGWTVDEANSVRRAVEKVDAKMNGKFRINFDTISQDLVMENVTNLSFPGNNTGGGFTVNEHKIEFAILARVEDSRQNNIVHELGHAFNRGRCRGPENRLPAALYGNRYAFLHDNKGVMWQASPNRLDSASEGFADMFLAWTYGVWANPIDKETLRKAAPDHPEYQDPPGWMESYMQRWLR
jgi:hypothetical protein